MIKERYETNAPRISMGPGMIGTIPCQLLNRLYGEPDEVTYDILQRSKWGYETKAVEPPSRD